MVWAAETLSLRSELPEAGTPMEVVVKLYELGSEGQVMTWWGWTRDSPGWRRQTPEQFWRRM
jgi:hypothetical protein